MNLAGINLNLLVALEMLIEEANVTRAAEKFGLSQPAMSRTLRRLRALLGDPILMNTRHGLVPTPRARQVMPAVRRALELIRDTIEPRQPYDPLGATDTFNISWADVGQSVSLPSLLKRLKQEAPQVSFNFTFYGRDFTFYGREGRQYEALESGDIDLAVEASRDVPLGFHAEHLLDMKYACVARQDHPRIGKQLTLKKFLELGHIRLPPYGTVERQIDEILAQQSAQRRIMLTVPSYLPIPWLIVDSDLIATMPTLGIDMIVKYFPIKCYDPPIPLRPRPISIIWHECTHHEARYQWLRQTMLNIYRELCSGT